MLKNPVGVMSHMGGLLCFGSGVGVPAGPQAATVPRFGVQEAGPSYRTGRPAGL
jgi:hypothetical protein